MTGVGGKDGGGTCAGVTGAVTGLGASAAATGLGWLCDTACAKAACMTSNA